MCIVSVCNTDSVLRILWSDIAKQHVPVSDHVVYVVSPRPLMNVPDLLYHLVLVGLGEVFAVE